MKYVRPIILITNICIAIAVYLYWSITIPTGILQVTKIDQTYALLSVFFLYSTLLPSPLYKTFPSLPYRSIFRKALRALGVSAFLYAFLHACFSFFGLLGGFPGLPFLDEHYLLAISIAFLALTILGLLTILSLDYVLARMQTRWKWLYKLVYLAGVLIVIHALMLGSDFSDVSRAIPQIFFFALTFLLILESVRLDAFLTQRFQLRQQFGVLFVIAMSLISIGAYMLFFPTGTTLQSVNIHAAHIQLAKLAQQNPKQQFAVDTSKIPGLDGDRNKRYTVSMFVDPQVPLPNQNVTIRFRTFDATNGNPVNYFKFIYAKPMHLIIVKSRERSETVPYFVHIHPTQQGQDFVITTQFPAEDTYHAYIEFQPYGGIEQQIGFTIPVGNPIVGNGSRLSARQVKPFPTDADNTTKTFGNYTVTLVTHGQLSASAMSLGSQKISFTVTDAKTKQPVTNLHPYLASFGHLTMINETTYDFIHVHPYSIGVPPPNATAGPTVDFLPIGIYGPFKPGIYRAFAEFNPNGNLFTADFTVKVN